MATIVLADDQTSTREVTARVLREAGHRVILASDGQEALARVEAERPDLVILDVVMPRLDGIEACRQLKRSAAPEDFVPVLFLSSRSDPASRVAGFAAGAEDFLGKPFDPDELRARVAVQVRIKALVDEAMKGRAQLEDAVIHDPVTGLYNQRYLTQRLDEEFRRARRYNEPLSIMAVDLDQFEKVNGRFGRGIGDRLLETVAKALQSACREVDIVTRAGGDEFVLVLPNTHFAGSLVIAERIWHTVRGAGIEERATRVACEASVGVACYPNKDVTEATDLLRFAHAALERAKAEGRGKICLYQHQGYLFQPEPR